MFGPTMRTKLCASGLPTTVCGVALSPVKPAGAAGATAGSHLRNVLIGPPRAALNSGATPSLHVLPTTPKQPMSTVSLISKPGTTAGTSKVLEPKGWVTVKVPGFGVLNRNRTRWKTLISGGPANRAASRANSARPGPAAVKGMNEARV